MDSTEFLDRSAQDVIDELEQSGADMSVDDLEALHEAEAAGKDRTTVLATIARMIEAAEVPEESGKAGRGELPGWQKPDYTGPLSATQALWRQANITTK